MLLLLDIGNTSATYGIYKKGRISLFGNTLKDGIPKFVYKYIKNGRQCSINIVYCSVVPQISLDLRKSVKENKDCRLWEVGRNLPLKIKGRYRDPRTLGIDRKVKIFGALRLYRPPFLVLDFGTAITVDFVSRKGVFEGGMIIPGPELAFNTLIKRAALIPKNIRLPEKAPSFLGRSTHDCLASGILEGYGAMIDGLIDRFRSRYGKGLQVIATGGFASDIKAYSRKLTIGDPQHSIKSLAILFNEFCLQRRLGSI